jgi:hypothetical protein
MQDSSFLRRSLQIDGVASGLCGVLLLAGARPLSSLMGLAGPGIARMVGALFVAYAAALLWNAARARVSRGGALAAVVLNAAWVAGSAVVILDASLTALGNLAVAAVAVAVLLFAILEAVGLGPAASGGGVSAERIHACDVDTAVQAVADRPRETGRFAAVITRSLERARRRGPGGRAAGLSSRGSPDPAPGPGAVGARVV